MIRVAHILDGRHFGGGEQMVRRLIQGLPRVGVEAWGYCLSEGRLAQFLRAEGLPVRVFQAAGRFDASVLPRIARAAREDRLDLLQAHTSRTHLAARLLSLRLGIPNVTTIHSPIAQDENRSVTRHPLRAWVERLGRPWTERIVTVSREEGQRLLREEGVAHTKLAWIPNGVDPAPEVTQEEKRRELAPWMADEGLDPAAFTIAMIAQMRPRKGPEVLLRAFARWRREGGRGALVMIGDDEFTGGAGYLDSLKALARELGAADGVRFTGFLADPWRLARGASLVALPSLFGEGLPLVLLEAMNHAIPLAVSDTLGNRELAAEGRNGWLHPPGDDAALARSLAEAASRPDLMREKSQAARRDFLEHYTLDRVLRQWRELYEALTSTK